MKAKEFPAACPWCGGSAERHKSSGGFHDIRCVNWFCARGPAHTNAELAIAEWNKVATLTKRLATATELVRDAYPHIVALDDARNDGLSGRIAAFLNE